MITDRQQDRVTEQNYPAEQEGFSQGDEDYSQILRIAHAFVGADEDQPARWIIGRWCAVTTANEI